jgi:hypothetical protein
MIKVISIFIFCIIVTNNINSQNKLDSIFQSQPLTKIDQINRTRVLLRNEIFFGNKDFGLITAYQNYLNSLADANYNGLSVEENFLLYIYIQEWNSVLNIIPEMNYTTKIPYRTSQLSLMGKNIFLDYEIGRCSFFLIEKSKILNKQLYINISNSTLSEEQKDFLTIFIPNYWGYKYTQNKISIKTAYDVFKKKYPESQYVEYIRFETYDKIPSKIKRSKHRKYEK